MVSDLLLTGMMVVGLGENCYSRPMLIPSVPADLCLLYANTLSWRGRDVPAETLHRLDDVLDWIARAALLGPRAAADLKHQAGSAAAAEAGNAARSRLFAQTLAMREAIFRLFSAAATGAPPPPRDFAALTRALAAAPVRDRLVRRHGACAWHIPPPGPAMPDILAPVLWSAGDLLLDAQGRRIQQCANDECLWLFIDGSKNGTRRWCDMASCGNRAKARRHYSRIRQA